MSVIELTPADDSPANGDGARRSEERLGRIEASLQLLLERERVEGEPKDRELGKTIRTLAVVVGLAAAVIFGYRVAAGAVEHEIDRRGYQTRTEAEARQEQILGELRLLKTQRERDREESSKAFADLGRRLDRLTP